MKIAKSIFIFIDKILNWIAGGSIKNTISGRVGFYANHANTKVRWYWITMQKIIDFTFFPLDGLNHCHDAYHRDKSKDDYKPTKRIIFFFILSLVVIWSCWFLYRPFYLLYFIGIFNQKNI